MKRLWVRISVGITTLLILIVFLPFTVWNITQFKNRREEKELLHEQIDISELPEERGHGDGINPLRQSDWIQGVPNQFVVLAVSALALGVVSGIWISRSLSSPIGRLANAAEHIGKGDLDYRIEVGGSQEITDLATSFNRMAAQLQDAEQVRSNLVADVAHELRTPLTALESNLRAALDQIYPLDENAIAALYGQTQHLIRLVKDLELLTQADARQLTLNIEPTDLNTLIQETVDFFLPVGEEYAVAIHTNLAPDLPLNNIDPSRIRQVLHNLITNALRHTPENGAITLTTRTEAENVVISVVDTGTGIEPQQLPNIFNRFYRGEPSRQHQTEPDAAGSGLGLPIAQAIITAHGGAITVTSPGLDQGSSFTITLPASG